jgi:hypothetical protein
VSFLPRCFLSMSSQRSVSGGTGNWPVGVLFWYSLGCLKAAFRESTASLKRYRHHHHPRFPTGHCWNSVVFHQCDDISFSDYTQFIFSWFS